MLTKILLIGCGDIAIRLSAQLPTDSFQFYGLRRRIERLPSHIHGIAHDLNQPQGLPGLIEDFQVVVITLVPNSRDESGYRQAFGDNLEKIIQALERSPVRPKLVLFVSSTSVYGQTGGEWVDEDSPTHPGNFRGRAVLAGEDSLRNSPLNECVVRFSGIYGPGRDRLIRQVKSGEHSDRDGHFSNRIHAEDCAGVLAHLIRQKLEGKSLEPIYLASDREPVPLAQVKQWLAERLGVPYSPGTQFPGGKRCSNEKLLASGYQFRYPDFREGYRHLLQVDGQSD